MLISWPQVPQLQDIDLCVVGAGAAGITLVRQFAERNERVLLIESGGFEFSQAAQSLYDTGVVGNRYPISGSRLRFFGGTTNHWTGQSRPLEPIDFEERLGIYPSISIAWCCYDTTKHDSTTIPM